MNIHEFILPTVAREYVDVPWSDKPPYVRVQIAAALIEEYLSICDGTDDEILWLMNQDLKFLEHKEAYESCVLLKYTIEQFESISD